MKKRIIKKSKGEVNNLANRIKGHYPHLYAELGGRYIRRVLKRVDGAFSANAKIKMPNLV